MAEPTDVYATSRQGFLVRLANPLAARARRRRQRLFAEAVSPRPGEAIVDVGCGRDGLGAVVSENPITGVDRVPRPSYEKDGRKFVQADARALPFEAQSFNIAYSNSLIEHLEPADRPRFAAEIRRVAGRYFVQTPNRWFPIEPHVLLPLFHLLPLGLRRLLWRFGVSRGPFEDIRLLGAGELRALFPDCAILRERLGPLTKSLIAVGPVDGVSGDRGG